MKTIAQQLKIKDFPFIIKDKNGNVIYYENFDGYWWKSEYDAQSNEIYLENSDGYIKDNRPKIDQPTYAMLAKMRDRAKIAENQLAAVTEQRDRLAENLKQIYNVSSFDYDTMPEAARKKYREVVFAIADKALQSLTEKLT